MKDINDLYQALILDHSQSPYGRGQIESPTHLCEGYNPVCGDKITVRARCEGDKIVELKFEGQSCAICTASASLMVLATEHATHHQVDMVFDAMHKMLVDKAPPDECLKKLQALEGVKNYPLRIKCATLPWHTLKAALAHSAKTTTEVLKKDSL